MKWFKEHKKVATIGLAGIFLLVLVLIGCGVAFSGSRNGSDQKEQEASVTDQKKDTVTEEKSSDTEVKKEDAAKEDVSEEKTETKEEAKKEEKTEKRMIPRKPVLHQLRLRLKRMKQKLLPISHPAIPVQRRQRQNPTDPVLPVAVRVSRSIHIPG
ncbi:MAG: hypothetical protein ACLS5E_06325 [[Ruminococcus] lactaris]